MIDIHSHIIPNVDDGSESVKETFKMIEEAKKIGFTDIILTSQLLSFAVFSSFFLVSYTV